MIRRLQGAGAVAHSADIARILAAAFEEPGQQWSAESVAATLGTPGCVALLAPGGCALLRTAGGEAEVLTIAVTPGARRRGLGAALLDACLAAAAAAGAGRLLLEVSAANEPAISLYARAGFAEIGRRRDYYAGRVGREDAVLMARDLQ